MGCFMKEFYINSTVDGEKIYCVDFCENLKNPKMILQICHGMVEHIKRYKDFAKFLEKQGIRAFGMDNRGHGQNCDEDSRGHISDEDGDIKLVEDVYELNKYIKKEFPDKQVVIFGHSMGSVIVRNFLNKYSPFVDGAIICGTTGIYNMKYRLFMLLSKIFSSNNKRKKSTFLNKLAFRGFNSRVEEKNTEFDWLTTDKKIVEEYILDKNCGFLCTNKFFYDFLKLVKEMSFKNNIENVKKNLPILFISGKDDPVGNYCKGVFKSYRIYKNLGIKNIKLKLYAKMRHEVLNEVDREKVYIDIYKFLESIN